MKFIFLAALSLLPATAHDHFAAGIVDANNNGAADAGEPLQFVGANGAGRVFHLLPRPVGFHPAQRCGGYYMLDERPRTLYPNDTFTMTALSDGQYDIASPRHAHTGSWIWCEIVSVTGPAGANFGFWDQDQSFYFDVPTISLPTNQPAGAPRFAISEGIDDAAEDPSGHIHARSWTADRAGDYAVSFRLVDQSTSGPGGGPWHSPSAVYTFHFQAGPEFQLSVLKVPGAGCDLTWPSRMGIHEPSQTGIVFTIMRSTTLAGGGWTAIGTVPGTTAATARFTDPSPPAAKAFYRLAYDWSAR